jgi:hypothetical protein
MVKSVFLMPWQRSPALYASSTLDEVNPHKKEIAF